MAKSTIQGNRGVIIFDETDFCGGLAPQGAFSSATVKQTNQSGMATLVAIDPFRNSGILQPGMSPESATNPTALAGALLAGAFDPTTNTLLYGVDAGGRFQQIDYVNNTITNAGSFPHTITGTNPVGQDCIIYQHNSSSAQVYSVFYSYYNNTNWNIGALVNMTGVPNDVFMSSIPANPLDIASPSPADGQSIYQRTASHPMCIGSDAVLYIGSGRYIHAYDGNDGTANGTFISQVLTLPAGFNVQGMVKYNDTLLIAGNYGTASLSGGAQVGGSSAVYIWDYLTIDSNQIIPLNDPYVSSIFIWRGGPAVITYGPKERNGYIKIKRIVGNQAQRVADLPPISAPGASNPVLRGVDPRQNTLYINVAGQVITIGNKFTGEGYDINYLGFASVAQNSGWIYNLQTDSAIPSLVLSSSNGTTHTFSRLFGGYSTSNCFTQFYEPSFPPLKQGRALRVTVYYFQEVITSNQNPLFTMSLYTDYGTQTTLISGSQSLASPLIKKYEESNTGTPLPFFSSLGLQFVWASGGSNASATHQISKVIVEFELEDFTT